MICCGRFFFRRRLDRAHGDVKEYVKDSSDPATVLARVVDVYDGDTITVLTASTYSAPTYMLPCLPLRVYKVRLAKFDSPEMKPSKTDPTRDAQKAAAVKAKERMTQLAFGKCINLEVQGRDKYGRLLANFQVDDGKGNLVYVDQLMVAEGHAVPYDGGTKATFKPSSSAFATATDGEADGVGSSV